ncbi:MAG: ABC transporter substrate-binding protein [Polyangia bacterium]
MHTTKVATNRRFGLPGLRGHAFAAYFGLVLPTVRSDAATAVPGSLYTASQGGDLSPTLGEPLKSPVVGPIAELRRVSTALKRLFQKQPPSWSPENEVKRSRMRKIASELIDFDDIARRSLGGHWDDIVPQQRHEFIAVLRDLIERNYLKRVHDHPDYDLRFERETLSGSTATVAATLDAEDNGKKVSVRLECRLLQHGGHWWVLDVVTNDQSMLENYRAEFNGIIMRESFEGLLKHMRKRLEKDEREGVLRRAVIQNPWAVEGDPRRSGS